MRIRDADVVKGESDARELQFSNGLQNAPIFSERTLLGDLEDDVIQRNALPVRLVE